MGKQIDADKLIEHFINKTPNGWLVPICENESRWTLEGIISEIEYFVPTVEAIPKADYETRLKADLKAMLTDIYMEIEELDTPSDSDSYDVGIVDCEGLIQEKINALKEQ